MTPALMPSPSASPLPQATAAVPPRSTADRKPDNAVREGGTANPSPAPMAGSGKAGDTGAASSASGNDPAEAPASFGAALDQMRVATAARQAAKAKDAAAVADAPATKPHADEEVPDDALLLTAWMGPSLEAARLAGALTSPAAELPATDGTAEGIGDSVAGRGLRESLAVQIAAIPPALAGVDATPAMVGQAVAAAAAAAPATFKALSGAADATSPAELPAFAALAEAATAAGQTAAPDARPASLDDPLLKSGPPLPASTQTPTTAAASLAAAASAATGTAATADATLPAQALAAASERAVVATTSDIAGAAARRDSDADSNTFATPTPLSAPTGATALAQATGTGATARPAIAPEVGSNAWGPALGQQMIRIAAQGERVAELELNPIGLGPLKVRLAVNDNQAQAMFMSGHESVRQAVEAALPQLRTTLASHGISLGQTSVGADPGQAFFAGTGAGRDPSQQQPQQHGARATPFDAGADVPAPVLIAPPQVMRPVRSGAGFTTFA